MFARKSCLIQEIWSSNNDEVAFDWQTRNNNVDLCLYVSEETFPAEKKIFPGPRHLSTVLGKHPTGITFFLLLFEKSLGNIVSQHKRNLRKLIDTGHCCQAGTLIVFLGRNLFKQLSLVRHRLEVIQNNDFSIGELVHVLIKRDILRFKLYNLREKKW